MKELMTISITVLVMCALFAAYGLLTVASPPNSIAEANRSSIVNHEQELAKIEAKIERARSILERERAALKATQADHDYFFNEVNKSRGQLLETDREVAKLEKRLFNIKDEIYAKLNVQDEEYRKLLEDTLALSAYATDTILSAGCTMPANVTAYFNSTEDGKQFD